MTIQKIERDERRPSVQLAHLLARALQVPEIEQDAFVRRARGEYVPNPGIPDTIGLADFKQQEKPSYRFPPQVTPIIGREEELVALEALLRNVNTRLITIVGPGGVGKTHVAVTVGHRYLDDPLFANGTVFVSLASLTDSEEIVSALADALQLPWDTLDQQWRTLQQQVFDYLRHRQMLIILDNFEHLLNGALLVHELLLSAPQVKVLVTSREHLQLQEEQLFPLRGLDVPGGSGSENLHVIAAVQLFVQAAQRHQPDFIPSSDDLAIIGHVCRLVGGLPLAIRLAAGWVNTVSVKDIATEIQEGLEFLATEVRNVSVRHQSMQAIFDSTWQYMSEKERTIFCQLSTFKGGFTRQSAHAVAQASLLTLSHLVSKSLLYYDLELERYQIHELLRQYGLNQLKADQALEEIVYERYSAHFCRFLHKQESQLKSSGQQTALSEIEAEIGNVRAAWRWAAQHEQSEQLALAMNSLGLFHEWTGQFREGERLFAHASETLKGTDISQEALVLARLLAWQSVFSRHIRGKGSAMQLCQQAVELLQSPRQTSQNTTIEQAFVYLQIALASEATDAIRKAVEKSLTLSTEINNRWMIAEALECLGNGNFEAAHSASIREHLEACLALRQSLGDQRGVIRVLTQLSLISRYQGDFISAECLAETAYASSQELAYQASIAASRLSLGYSYAHLAKFDEAKAITEESVNLYEDLGNLISSLDARHWLGVIAWMGLGNKKEGYTFWQKAHQKAKEMGLLNLTVELEWCLGSIKLVEQDYEGAIEIYTNALRKIRDVGTKRIEGWILSDMAYAHHRLAGSDQARHLNWQALSLAVESHHFVGCQFALHTLIIILAAESHLRRAIELETMICSLHPLVEEGWYFKQMRAPLAKQIAGLPGEVVAAARERGRQLDYWQTAKSLLTELKDWQVGNPDASSSTS